MRPFLTIAILIITAGAFAQAPKAHKTALPAAPIDGAVWKQTFADEFDGTVIDPNHWNIRHENRTPRKNDFWHRECAKLDGNGLLRMITRKSIDTPDWHDTACIETQRKFTQRYGYFEIRAEMQSQPGFWSAFWAMPAPPGNIGSTKYGGMDGTELDIYEKNTLDDKVQHTLHWDGYGDEHKSAGFRSTVPGVMDGFHTFGLLWTPAEYVFYVDAKETWRSDAGGVAQVPIYLKISSETGDWGGDITKAILPDEFRVDYVRAWQLYDENGKVAFTPKVFDNSEEKSNQQNQSE
jgi:beta-glucanase (GH16 family)